MVRERGKKAAGGWRHSELRGHPPFEGRPPRGIVLYRRGTAKPPAQSHRKSFRDSSCAPAGRRSLASGRRRPSPAAALASSAADAASRVPCLSSALSHCAKHRYISVTPFQKRRFERRNAVSGVQRCYFAAGPYPASTSPLRSTGGCFGLAGSGYGGCNPTDRSERGDLLSLAPRIWRLKIEQVKRLKELELENNRLRKAVSDLTLDKLILQEAARGNF